MSWIGCQITIGKAWIVASIKAERISDLRDLTIKIRSHNLVSIKELRSYLGKAANFAQLLFSWRPFVHELWSALTTDPSRSGVAHNCVWVRQIDATLRWILAFLDAERGSIIRVFALQAFRGRGTTVRISTDACPWGIGGVIYVDGAPTAYFSSALAPEDFARFGYEEGNPAGQQCWEALAVLVAMRLWSCHWRRVRIILEVRADNITALTMLTSQRGRGTTLTLINRELALYLGSGVFRPQICSHSPGVAHKVADTLSRRFCPNYTYRLPVSLSGVQENLVPARDSAYFRTLDRSAEQNGS